MKKAIITLLVLITCIPAFGEDLDGKTYLKDGKLALENGKYDEAVVSLTRAEKEFPVLGDYALFWLSDAYHQTGDFKQALLTVRAIFKRYPNSPLIKKSRSREIDYALQVPEENIRSLFEAFLNDYPDEREMKYFYALWLKKTGYGDRAKPLFKEIYRDARSFSSLALQELDASDIGIRDMLKHASNQIALMNYKAAESVLKNVLEKDDGRHRPEILRELGLALFKQKKYREAADVYRRAGERYWEIRSLYRAGEKNTLVRARDELLALNDKRIGSLLVSLAADMRRDGKSEDAIRLYQAVMEKFPSETEEALWGIGWTYFLGGEYQKASELFCRLADSHNDSKYLYWKVRSLELSGGETAADLAKLRSADLNYYTIMLNARSVERRQPQSDGKMHRGSDRRASILRGKSVPSGKVDRVDHLLDLGFRNEALAEMIHISKNAGSANDLYYLCSRFQELGEYRLSVRLASRIADSSRARQFLYPLAYKEVIESLSARYSVDPLLVLSIVREESRFDYEARSPAGAIGLMQLMPTTAFRLNEGMKVGIRHSQDLTDSGKNLHVGIYYLSALIREFGAYPPAIAAYNAGEDIVRKWLQQGKYKSADEFIEDIPYSETRQYVKRVLTTFFEYKRSYSDDYVPVMINLGSM